MNKRTAQSAVFNLSHLIGLLVGLTGVILVLLGLDAFAVPAASITQARQSYTSTKSIDPLVPAGFDCSRIRALGIDKQENLRAGAIMIFCGEAQRGSASPVRASSRFVQKLLRPVEYGTTDVDLITGTETFPHVDQSTTFTAGNPDNPLQIVVAYNDARGIDASPSSDAGASVSTDGGNTFTRLTAASGQGPFPNCSVPVVLYNKPSQTWFTVWSDGGCGGLGGFKSTTPWDPNSWTHYCIHTGNDDRQSGWADNNPSSPFYGRMYISWNDFGTTCGVGGCLFETFSSDGGTTWSTPVQVQTVNTFVRNVQITGDLATGDIYIAGMDEGGGGFPHNDTNYIFKSSDGGNTWTNTYVGTPFPGPGVTAVGYFAMMFPDNGGYWRYEGWGEPAALNGVVHLVYAQHGTGSDPGDVYYIRSSDGGATFGAPVKLNTDATTRAQWEPSLSVAADGSLFATWYDARETETCTEGDPAVPCYRMWARKSTDNGLSWLPDDMFSDVISPLPGQPDPLVISTYASDYDYASAPATTHLSSWVDGRVTINGISQQDAFFDSEPSTPSPTPTITATPTPRVTPTPRIAPTPRSRPTPPARL
jgi:hypothetical protein